MVRHEKARAAGGTAERAKETAAFAGATDSTAQHSTAAAERQGICALLLHGEANAQTATELARITGRTPREITRAIQRARLTGKPICASGAGFFLASDARELARYVRGLDRRLHEIRRTLEAMDDVLAAATGQTRMED